MIISTHRRIYIFFCWSTRIARCLMAFYTASKRYPNESRSDTHFRRTIAHFTHLFTIAHEFRIQSFDFYFNRVGPIVNLQCAYRDEMREATGGVLRWRTLDIASFNVALGALGFAVPNNRFIRATKYSRKGVCVVMREKKISSARAASLGPCIIIITAVFLRLSCFP